MLILPESVSLTPETGVPTISDRYEIIRNLGKGSTGEVFLCRNRDDRRILAIKVLKLKELLPRFPISLFDSEISLSSRVHHPNVVQTFDSFVTNNLLAYTMEFVPGGSLTELFKKHRLLPIRKVIQLLYEICSGLSAIHQAGIIHNDLKPANILLTWSGSPKISDFGISSDRTHGEILNTDKIFGTAGFISPECLASGKIDARSDIFSLGVLAYQMVTGVSPFEEDTVLKTLSKRSSVQPVPPHIYRSDCPFLLSRLIQKAMMQDPHARFQTALQMQQELEEISEQTPLAIRKSSVAFSSVRRPDDYRRQAQVKVDDLKNVA